MILLLHKAHATIIRLREETDSHAHLGRLVCPANYGKAAESVAAGLDVAADNRAFVGFDDGMYSRMLNALEGVPVLWVTVPDVVGDAQATLYLWEHYELELLKRDLAPAFVAQDGLDPAEIPSEAQCLFVGGTDAYKFSADAEAAVREAKRRGLWVHVGRVNSTRRIGWAKELGADSIDGTQWSRFTSIYLNGGLAACSAPTPSRLFDDEAA